MKEEKAKIKLLKAIQKDNAKACDKILKSFPSLANDQIAGFYPLHYAIQFGSEKACRVLIKNNAELVCYDFNALNETILYDRDNIFDMIFNKKYYYFEDGNKYYGNDKLTDNSSENNNRRVSLQLPNSFEKLEKENRQRIHEAHFIAYRKELLVGNEKNGKTPLMLAAEKNNLKACYSILNADYNDKDFVKEYLFKVDKENKSVFDYADNFAEESGDSELIEYLIAIYDGKFNKDIVFQRKNKTKAEKFAEKSVKYITKRLKPTPSKKAAKILDSNYNEKLAEERSEKYLDSFRDYSRERIVKIYDTIKPMSSASRRKIVRGAISLQKYIDNKNSDERYF